MVTRPEVERGIQAKERKIEESWLQSLRDLAYDIQDITDEVSTETARHPPPTATRWTTLNFWVDLVCGCFAPSCLGYSADMQMLERCPLWFYVHVAYKIEAVYSQLENIKSEKERLNILPSIILRSQLPFVDSSARVHNDQTYEQEHRLTTQFLNKDFKLVGRDEEIAYIIGRLMDPEPKMLVIPIVGTGGMGKTTLAQVVFDDGGIKGRFDPLKWVFVGINFDVKSVLKLVLKELKPDNKESYDDLGEIYEGVVKEIKEKRFLIVLDDVWDDDRKKWEDLLTPLSHGKAGSRIIITTGEEGVARVACRDNTFKSLTPLSHEYGVELFEKHAFPDGCLDENSGLREIGKRIVTRLGGHPLALKVVGDALFGDYRVDSWNDILNTYDIMPALAWSYERLPYHVKQCFRYCSLFSRRGASQSKTVLIYLWIANGYIEPKENKSLEDIGNEYVNCLISRSFLKETTSEDFPDDIIEMHDLIYDLAKRVCKGEFVKIDENTKSGDFDPLKIRHLAIYDGNRCPNTVNWERLRTIAVADGKWKIPRKIFSQLHSIRVIIGVSGEEIHYLTRNMIHLRYLCMNYIHICTDSVEPLNRLHNLQSLLLQNAYFLEDSFYMIQSLSKLTNLRILHIYLRSNPMGVEGVGNLTSLRYLQTHVIHDKDGCRIGELKNLSQLHGELEIYNLENVQDGEALEAMLHEKTYLKELNLVWNTESDIETRAESLLAGSVSHTEYDVETSAAPHRNNHESVLEGLRPHSNLKKLHLSRFGGSFCRPNWMGEQLTGMVEIQLFNCRNMVDLPPLGQLPRLKKLVFGYLDRLQRVTAQFYGNVSSSGGVVFPSLESLVFLDLREWREWQGVQDKNLRWFPCLQELVILGCPKLRELPSNIREMTITNTHFPLPHVNILETDSRLLLYACDPTKLKRLDVSLYTSEGTCITSEEMQWWQSLTSLEELTLLGADDLLLSSWVSNFFQNTVSLKKLSLRSCYGTHSLPEKELPPSLQQLDIGWRCPLLAKRYQDGGPGRKILLDLIPCLNIVVYGN